MYKQEYLKYEFKDYFIKAKLHSSTDFESILTENEIEDISNDLVKIVNKEIERRFNNGEYNIK